MSKPKYCKMPQKMNWTVTYLVGVPQLDKDHEVIFEELEKLYYLLKEGGSQEDMLEQALLVRKEARLHFAGEEALMEWLGYHEIDLHIAEHKMLMEQINSLLDEIREGLIPSEKELQSFVEDWLYRHIRDEDMQYARMVEQIQRRSLVG